MHTKILKKGWAFGLMLAKWQWFLTWNLHKRTTILTASQQTISIFCFVRDWFNIIRSTSLKGLIVEINLRLIAYHSKGSLYQRFKNGDQKKTNQTHIIGSLIFNGNQTNIEFFHYLAFGFGRQSLILNIRPLVLS